MRELKEFDLGGGVTVQATEEYAKRVFPHAVLVGADKAEVKTARKPRNKARAAENK